MAQISFSFILLQRQRASTLVSGCSQTLRRFWSSRSGLTLLVQGHTHKMVTQPYPSLQCPCHRNFNWVLAFLTEQEKPFLSLHGLLLAYSLVGRGEGRKERCGGGKGLASLLLAHSTLHRNPRELLCVVLLVIYMCVYIYMHICIYMYICIYIYLFDL